MLSFLFSDPLPVGSKAPDWTLKDAEGKSVSLPGLRGKNVVLVFYPMDNTSTCTAQLCEFRDAWEEAKGKNTVVFGINRQGAKSHTSFQEKNRLPFPLLVDEDGAVCKAYHTHSFPVIKRTVYLIGPDGTIRYARRGKPAVGEVLAAAA